MAGQAQDAKELAEFARSGSAEAFASLSTRYAGLVYRACLRRLGSEADAEDASQAVFLALARKAGRVKPSKLASWLHGASIRAARHISRSRANRARYERKAAEMKSQEELAPQASGREVLKHLDREVERLPAKLREAVARHYLAGLSRSEVAGELGIPEGTVQGRLNAGLEKLRARLGGGGVRLGAAALGTLLASEASAGAPASLIASLPALVGCSAASVAAAGAGLPGVALAAKPGAGVSLIAEGILKAMLWTKIKIGIATVAAVTVIAGVGTPLTMKAVAGGKRKGPVVAAKPTAIKARVVAVKPSPLDGPSTVSIDRGSDHGVKEGWVFKISRDGKEINEFTVKSLAAKRASGQVKFAGAWLPARIVKVGDLASTKLTVIDPGKRPRLGPVIEAKAVNGLRLRLLGPDHVLPEVQAALAKPVILDMKHGTVGHTISVLSKMTGLSIAIRGEDVKRLSSRPVTLHLERRPVREALDLIARQHPDLPWKVVGGRHIWLGRAEPGTELREYRLRWGNFSKKPLVIYRNRNFDLRGRVLVRAADGRMLPARKFGGEVSKGMQQVRIEPGKVDAASFRPWHWVVKPTASGEYTLWVEFEQKFPPKGNMNAFPKGYWIGKIRSNSVKIVVPAAHMSPGAGGLAWLASVQGADGHWDSAKFGAKPADDLAATSAALMAFFGAGHTDREGKYKANVSRALNWLLRQQKADGSFKAPVFSQAFATLALSEAYGMTRRADLGAGAEKSLKHHLKHFRAKAARITDDEACGIALLARSGAAAGIAEGNELLKVGQKSIREQWAKAKGGPDLEVIASMLLGVKVPKRWQPYAQRLFAKAGMGRHAMTDWIYTIAAFRTGGEAWRTWNTRMKTVLASPRVNPREADGSWAGAAGQGRVVATALNCLTLEVYYRFLPMTRTDRPRPGVPATKPPPPREPQEVF